MYIQLALMFCQPLYYMVIFVVYIIRHKHIENGSTRFEKICALTIPYFTLQQLKLLASFEDVNLIVYGKFLQRDKFKFLNLENSYRTQLYVEIAAAVPQLFVQVVNNQLTKWDDRGIRVFSAFVSLVLIFKNLTMLMIY